MYLFEAHYINMNDNSEVTRKIEVEEQFFDSEKEIYLYDIFITY